MFLGVMMRFKHTNNYQQQESGCSKLFFDIQQFPGAITKLCFHSCVETRERVCVCIAYLRKFLYVIGMYVMILLVIRLSSGNARRCSKRNDDLSLKQSITMEHNHNELLTQEYFSGREIKWTSSQWNQQYSYRKNNHFISGDIDIKKCKQLLRLTLLLKLFI